MSAVSEQSLCQDRRLQQETIRLAGKRSILNSIRFSTGAANEHTTDLWLREPGQLPEEQITTNRTPFLYRQLD